MKKANGVTVIIPTYNREKFIGRAITSVLEQICDREIEIIVSDDGSSDETLAIANKFRKYVHILEKPQNCISQGAAATRNRGILASTTSYISFLDSDDFFLPGHLQQMVVALESKTNSAFAFCRLLEVDENRDETLFRLWSKSNITDRDIEHLTLSKHNVAQTNGFIFKKHVFEKVGFFDENLSNGEDNDLWMRVSEIYKGTFSNHYGAVIRKHGMGQLTNADEEYLRLVNIEIFERAIKRYKTLGLTGKFKFIKLYYITYKYKALGIPFLKRIINTVEKQTDIEKENLRWKPLKEFLDVKSIF